jgi:hypothetical protein
MRVLVVSEGRHELGKQVDGGQEEPGALKVLLRKLAGDDANVIFECDRMSSNAVRAWHGKGPGHFKRAVGWLKEAEKRRVDALILLIDDDKKPRERRSQQIADAQGSSLSVLSRAMGVAIRTFDAWILADEKALTDVLGYTVTRQPDPETIRDPKEVCARLLANGQNRMAQSEMYAEVAHRIDINILSSRCPTGFRPFAGYVRQVFVQEECS